RPAQRTQAVNGVFLDTVGLLGLGDEDDQWHDQPTLAFEEMSRRREPLFITSYIIAECANATARWIERGRIETLARALHTSGGFIFPTGADWKVAWSRYTGGAPGEAGLVDHLSFAVMQRFELR